MGKYDSNRLIIITQMLDDLRDNPGDYDTTKLANEINDLYEPYPAPTKWCEPSYHHARNQPMKIIGKTLDGKPLIPDMEGK